MSKGETWLVFLAVVMAMGLWWYVASVQDASIVRAHALTNFVSARALDIQLP